MSEGSTRITVHTRAFPALGRDVGEFELVVVEGPDAPKSVRIEGEGIVVGTGADADLRLTDERVSAQHIEVRRDGDTVVVRDLDSRNGTILDGSVVTEATVRAGATFKLGRTFVRVVPESAPLQLEPSRRRRFGELVAESLPMREVFRIMELAAASDVTVLVEGETGTGKELAARAIHDASRRRSEPFVVVDCGSLPESLLESELFGHVAGAFTGASGDRKGAFQRADGGTVFLDELDKVPLEVQARLLRAVENQTVRPVGADDVREVDVRIIGAGQALEAMVDQGTFRPDLFYRLSVVHVHVPPLRERLEDLRRIVEELLRRRGVEFDEIAGPNLERLRAHGWPGNVRELRNVVERALAMTPGAESFDDLHISTGTTGASSGMQVRTDLPFAEAKKRVIATFERRYLAELIERNDGNISAAARDAGTDRKYLRKLLRRHDLI